MHSFTVFCSFLVSLNQYSFSHLCFASSLDSSFAFFAPYLIFSSCFFFALSNLAHFHYFAFFLHFNLSFLPSFLSSFPNVTDDPLHTHLSKGVLQVQSQHSSSSILSHSRHWQPIRCTYGTVTSFAGSQHPIR